MQNRFKTCSFKAMSFYIALKEHAIPIFQKRAVLDTLDTSLPVQYFSNGTIAATIKIERWEIIVLTASSSPSNGYLPQLLSA
jgi:hypothetical protein